MGVAVQRYAYDAFGNIKFTPFPIWIKQPYIYTAREFDSETNLYYYRARYYDPSIGRFITRDPIGFDGGDYNLYAYVENNSVNLVDPMGTTCGSWWNDWAVLKAPGGHDFTNCCQKHDDCYAGKNNQCYKSKQQCDDEFFKCMKSVCDYQHLSSRKCYSYASRYWNAVRRLGAGAYKSGRKDQPCCQKFLKAGNCKWRKGNGQNLTQFNNICNVKHYKCIFVS